MTVGSGPTTGGLKKCILRGIEQPDKGERMSYWTHIIGVLHVDTYIQSKQIQAIVEELLKDAPQITGSERNADIYVNVPAGHNCWTSRDCSNCEWEPTKQYFTDGFECDAPPHFDCPSGEYMTRVVITVQGDLRDRIRSQTRKEWNAFHRFIAKDLGFIIRIATCRIDGLS